MIILLLFWLLVSLNVFSQPYFYAGERAALLSAPFSLYTSRYHATLYPVNEKVKTALWMNSRFGIKELNTVCAVIQLQQQSYNMAFMAEWPITQNMLSQKYYWLTGRNFNRFHLKTYASLQQNWMENNVSKYKINTGIMTAFKVSENSEMGIHWMNIENLFQQQLPGKEYGIMAYQTMQLDSIWKLGVQLNWFSNERILVHLLTGWQLNDHLQWIIEVPLFNFQISNSFMIEINRAKTLVNIVWHPSLGWSLSAGLTLKKM